MPQGGLRAETPRETPGPLRGQRDFRQQHQHLPSFFKARGNGLHIDFGLSRSCHPFKQRDRKPVLRHRVAQGMGHVGLLALQHGRGVGRVGEAERRRRRQHDLTQAARLRQSAHDAGADPRLLRQFGGRKRRARARDLKDLLPRGRQAQVRGHVARHLPPGGGAGGRGHGVGPQRHGQHHARWRQGVGRDPVDEAAQGGGDGRQVQPGADRAQPARCDSGHGGRHEFGRQPQLRVPYHAGFGAPAQRYGDDIARLQVACGRHAVIQRAGKWQGQHDPDALRSAGWGVRGRARLRLQQVWRVVAARHGGFLASWRADVLPAVAWGGTWDHERGIMNGCRNTRQARDDTP
ncbi:hypothetical protein KMAL_26870 [Novacetimonas maltaceti]|uniref:Uncharacterized protein n=1 Tax=Novacetimonas maltaceti TaxID=1203393 RepID=A0A2S3VYJ6_9PROT|nr:hypothetical protein KMAL_26870 [Novacetimonas maltaceti]